MDSRQWNPWISPEWRRLVGVWTSVSQRSTQPLGDVCGDPIIIALDKIPLRRKPRSEAAALIRKDPVVLEPDKMDATITKAGVVQSSTAVVKIDEIIPTVLQNERKSLKEEETASSTRAGIESIQDAMCRGMTLEVDKEGKQPPIVPASEKGPSIQTTNQNNEERLDRLERLVGSIQKTLTEMHDLARVSERMRRIDFMLSNVESIPLLDPYSQQFIYQLKLMLFVVNPHGHYKDFGLRGFVYESLARFRQGGGMLLPPDVVFRVPYSTPLTPEELKADCLKVHDMMVNHFRFLLGPGIWLEEDDEGKKMYYH